MSTELKKILRFVRIYGFRRTLYKIAGRKRGFLQWLRPRHSTVRDIGIIGCGQFAFSTIGCIITKCFGNRFIDCFDTDSSAHNSFADFYRLKDTSRSGRAVIDNPKVKLVYIASNHSSHADYAIEALGENKSVYCEKPICVNENQAERLFKALKVSKGRFYAGYNRPYSGAIKRLREASTKCKGPITLNCFIVGHFLPDNHWYRLPEEGTRICGNVGHWIDLTVHMLYWTSNPDVFEVHLSWSNEEVRDENMSVTITTPKGDLSTIVLTSRSDPFEGINESINFHQEEVTAKIDDFRRMTLWCGEQVKSYRYWPKDVGHVEAILQPFKSESRSWAEVETSTLLILHIAGMVQNKCKESVFSVSEALKKFQA